MQAYDTYSGLVEPRAEEVRGGLTAAVAPHEGSGGAVLSSALCDSDRAKGTAWSCVRGGAAGGWGQGLLQRVVGMERAAQGCGHGPKCQSSRSI